jgi:rhodanese-related sulfurtransferase
VSAPDVEDLSAAELRTYMERRHEKDYLLIDVRQPFEYARGHIPGARFLPLMELEASLYALPAERDLVFYCHSGGRSQAAAALAAEAEVTRGRIINLAGGMLAWDGAAVAGQPRVQIFDQAAGLAELLLAAMNLEKGAWRFYGGMQRRLAGGPLAERLAALGSAEIGHARLIYPYWAQSQAAPPPFETLFQRLEGEILEGGQPLESAMETLAALPEGACLRLLELALAMETAAFDLYRTLAERRDGQARSILLDLSQAEKRHLRSLVDALADCPS